MKRKLALSFLLAICMIFSCACNLVKSADYYELNGDDSVISFTNVVGDRKVSTKKIDMTNAIQSIAYSYKEIENAYVEAETYIDYLLEEEGFYYSGMLNMDETEDEITIHKTSPDDEEYEIRVIVRYSNDTKTVKITVQREKNIK
jgi:hypothetical protein